MRGGAGAVTGQGGAFPWDETLAFALGVLRWAPATFWAATPREVAAAARGVYGPFQSVSGPPGAHDLAALLAAFPDEEPP